MDKRHIVNNVYKSTISTYSLVQIPDDKELTKSSDWAHHNSESSQSKRKKSSDDLDEAVPLSNLKDFHEGPEDDQESNDTKILR